MYPILSQLFLMIYHFHKQLSTVMGMQWEYRGTYNGTFVGSNPPQVTSVEMDQCGQETILCI